MRKSYKLTDEQLKEYKKSIGGRLCIARIKKGLSQSDLAEKIGCNDQTISNYETNSIDIMKISFEKIIKICDVLEIDVYYLLGEVKNHSSKEIEFICEYTGLSEKTVKYLHKSPKESFIKENFSKWLSDLLDNYPEFLKLLSNLQSLLINNLKYKTLCNIDNKDDYAVMQNVLDRCSMDAKVALIECQNNLSCIKDTNKDDKFLYEIMTYTSPTISSILTKKQK